jgi:hypothetical protein
MDEGVDTLDEANGAAEAPTLEQICATMTKDQRYAKFLGMLHARKMTVTLLSKLATKTEKSRTHVIQVLQGRREGKHTWARLVDYLERDELIVLGKKDLIVVPDTIKSST